MSQFARPTLYLTLLAALIPAGVANAQPDAGAKIRGEYNFYGSSAGSAMRSAREHSTYYREYAQSAPAKQINPRSGARRCRHHWHLPHQSPQTLRLDANSSASAQRGDKETLTSLDVIDKNLAAAARSHREMLDTCLKADVDAAGSMKCCQQIDEPLATAISEHDKLLKTLASQSPVASTK